MIHTFTGGADGSEPQAGVVFDSAGNLYSASVYGGTLSAGNIFKLTKQSNQSWKETVLYNFTGGADGASPWDTPIFGLRRPSLRHRLRRRHLLWYRLRACAHIAWMEGDRTLHLPRRKHRPLPRWRPDPRFRRQSLWRSLKRRRRQPRSSLRNHGRRRKPVAHCLSLKALTCVPARSDVTAFLLQARGEEGAVRIDQWGETNENPQRRLHESPTSTKKNRKGGAPPSHRIC